MKLNINFNYIERIKTNKITKNYLEFHTSFDYSIAHKIMSKLLNNYKPTHKEKFMNSKMKEYFRLKLVNWKKNLLKKSSLTINNLQKNVNGPKSDITDRATDEIERSFELKKRDRERKLISKIDEALIRIKNGSYGYCEETGDPINIKRLEARPVATLSLEAQELHEKKEKIKLGI